MIVVGSGWVGGIVYVIRNNMYGHFWDFVVVKRWWLELCTRLGKWDARGLSILSSSMLYSPPVYKVSWS